MGQGKRKGMVLTSEKRKKLKQLIMQKAADEMRAEAQQKLEEKENHLKKVIGPFSLDGLDKAGLEAKVKELNKRVNAVEEEVYDLEIRNQRQEWEINDLTGKVNDIRGKFVKPVLKKVSKTEQKMAKFNKKKSGDSAIRAELKSTGQNKYALEEKEEDKDKPDWREGRLAKEKTPEAGEDAAGEAAVEAPEETENAEDVDAGAEIELED